MPVKEGYEYADVPHEKTMAGPGYRYGCHSDKLGDHPRCVTGVTDGQYGWEEIGSSLDGEGVQLVAVRKEYMSTRWIQEVSCGHIDRAKDSVCEGCANRNRQ